MRRPLAVLIAAGMLGACGGGGSSSEIYPAPHPAAPQVISLGGPVVASPKLVEITFQGDSLQSQIDTFMQQLGSATQYWAGATAEYGVGPLQSITSAILNEAAPGTITDSDVQAWLQERILSGGLPANDENTIYVIYYPASTTVTMGGGSLCGMMGSNDFQGYHDDFKISSGHYVIYAVAGRCPSPVANLPEIDEVSAEASHEIIEAATDPLPTDNPAFIAVDNDHLAWELIAGPEIADMCAANPDAFYQPPGITTFVQHVWSDKAAAAGHDPCEPNGTSPYFNAAPVLNDTVTIPNTPFMSLTTKGVQIPVGASKAIEVDLFSDGPVGPWTVSGIDLSSVFFGATNPALSFSFANGAASATGQNGDKLQMTIKVLAAGPLGAEPFWISSTLGSGANQIQKLWVGVVGN